MSNEQNAINTDGQESQTANITTPEENENIEYSAFSDDIAPIGNQDKNSKTSDVSEDQSRIAVLEEELARTKDQMMRCVAEAENGRKRALKEREDASKFAVSSFSRDLLSVADNLRRALDSVPDELPEQHPQVKNLLDGIKATERELLSSFAKHGIQKTEPLNERFDPNFHEVMFETPMTDKQSGTIIQVIEAGYTLNGRILRPARVGIAKNETSQPTSSPPDSSGHIVDTQA